MNTYKCLIIDDEHLAHHILIQYIDKIDKLELVGQCYSAIEAINFIANNEIDIMFLDINMPELTGLELLESLNNPPKVILTTAYSEFALEGYEHGVIDYLLKPIRFSRFLKAINRVFDNNKRSIEPESITSIPDPGFIEIKEDFMTKKIDYIDIQYIQAYGNFLKIYTKDKMYIASATMKHYEQELPKEQFLRVHKSYFISISKVTQKKSDKIQIGNIEIPIGNSYKKLVSDRLEQK